MKKLWRLVLAAALLCVACENPFIINLLDDEGSPNTSANSTESSESSARSAEGLF